ncbi:hypothetical protein MferCBS31731_001476 [Microsporum ferrugineum]
MVPSPKPNPSFATNRLTTKNYKGGPPLSQVRGRPTRGAQKRAAEEEIQSPDNVSEQPKYTRRKAEPATDDEPLASSDEDEDESGFEEEISSIRDPHRRTLWSSKDLAYHLHEGEAASKKRRGSLTPTKTKQSKGKSRCIRPPASHPRPPDGENTGVFPNIRPITKRRQAGYGGSRGIHNIHASTPLKPQAARKRKREPSSEPDDGPEHSSQTYTSKGPKFKDLASFMEAHTSIPASSAREHYPDLLDFSDEFEVASLSSISSSFSAHIPAEVQEGIDRRTAAVTVCPVCEIPVDAELFKSFKSMEKMGQQSRFCFLHRRKTAEEQWKERRYPAIDWESFKERIENQFSKLESILSPESDSVYRKILKSSARDRNQQGNFRFSITNSELEKISTGYYGARGARNMMEVIIARFAPRVRELALSDSLVQAVGVSGYVQAVLVPELTTMLVKEDMGVDDEEARQIIQDSMEIGDLLNQQPDDAVELKDEYPDTVETKNEHPKTDSVDAN